MADTATLTPSAPTRGWTENQSELSSAINVSDPERLISLLGGGALAIYGLTRGSLGGLLLAGAGGALVCRGATGHCSLFQALGINTAEKHGPATSVPAGRGFKVEKSIVIDRPLEDLYRFWRNLENLPRFMNHLKTVKNLGNLRSHWEVKAPLGLTAAWDAEIITEKPNEVIGWRSLPGSTVANAGSVHFERAPDGRGTIVKVVMKYDPPAGKGGATIAQLFGEAPEQQIEEDLRRLKQLMESGAVPSSHGQTQSV